MNKYRYDVEYTQLVDDILLNNDFNKLDSIEHHGITRYDHSLKVSYYSYKIAKALKLDVRDVARAGLLHDFFMSSPDRTKKERFISTFNHPKKAARNAKEIFGINEKEEDIIKSHMFPVNLTVPKYAESWVVNSVDKCVGTYEFYKKFSYQLNYATNLLIIIVLNFIK